MRVAVGLGKGELSLVCGSTRCRYAFTGKRFRVTVLGGQVELSDSCRHSRYRRCEHNNISLLPRHSFRLRALIVIDSIVAGSGIRSDALEVMMARAFACMTEALGRCTMRCRWLWFVRSAFSESSIY